MSEEANTYLPLNLCDSQEVPSVSGWLQLLSRGLWSRVGWPFCVLRRGNGWAPSRCCVWALEVSYHIWETTSDILRCRSGHWLACQGEFILSLVRKSRCRLSHFSECTYLFKSRNLLFDANFFEHLPVQAVMSMVQPDMAELLPWSRRATAII